MKTYVVLKCLHGSWLYGLATPSSDHDYYEIYDFHNKNWRPKKQAKQRITDDQDELRISLERFTSLCFKGVPQAVEVLFAPEDTWVLQNGWLDIASEIKQQLPAHMPAILETYKRTAFNFFYSEKNKEKKQRHAFRLLLNAEELKVVGGMHARLTTGQIERVNELTTSFYSEEKFKDMMYEIFR